MGWRGRKFSKNNGCLESRSSRTIENKNPGNYKLTVYVYDSNGQLLDSTLTTFEVLPTKINWITGYGGKKIIGVDYNITYSILPQPTKKIVSVDYNVLMGWSNQ